MKRFSYRARVSRVLPLCAALWLCSTATRTQAQQAPRVAWQPEWQRVQPVEYAAALTFGLGTLAISLFVHPRDSGARGGVLFDSALRDLVRADTRAGRDAARVVGDLGFRSLALFPIIDAGLAWAVHGDGEVAWQMLAMDLEAMTFAGLVGVMTDHFIGRARPSEPACKKDPNYERFCNAEDEFSSFLSGHSVIAAAGAGVTCAHHLSLPLYGGGAGDIAACAAASALALTTGIARMVNDRHWATDVSVALIVGGVAGYGWHTWFHYRRADPAGSARLRMTLLPAVAPGVFSGTLVGQF